MNKAELASNFSNLFLILLQANQNPAPAELPSTAYINYAD